MSDIRRCESCAAFTMKQDCFSCKKKTSSIVPLKYTFHDKYARYRRTVKEEQRQKEGLL